MYIENYNEIFQSLCYFIQIQDKDFQYKYLEKLRKSISHGLHYPFCVIYMFTANDKDRDFVSKSFSYLSEAIMMYRIVYDKNYGELSQRDSNMQSKSNDQGRYTHLVEYCIVYLLYVMANKPNLPIEPIQDNYVEQQNYIHFCFDVIVDRNGDNTDFLTKILDRMLYCRDKKNNDNKYLTIFTEIADILLKKKTSKYLLREYDGPIYLPNLFDPTTVKISSVVSTKDIQPKRYFF